MSSTMKQMAVIELSNDRDTVIVVPARSIAMFTTAWIDNPSLWPQMAIWYDEDDVQCTILKIDGSISRFVNDCLLICSL